MATAPTNGGYGTDKARDNEMGADGVTRNDFEHATKHMSHEEKHAAAKAAKFGYGPLAHMKSHAESYLPGQRDCCFPDVSTDTQQPSVVNFSPVCTRVSKAANSPTQLPSVFPPSP